MASSNLNDQNHPSTDSLRLVNREIAKLRPIMGWKRDATFDRSAYLLPIASFLSLFGCANQTGQLKPLKAASPREQALGISLGLGYNP